MAIALKLYDDGRIHSASVVLPVGNYEGMPIVGALPEGNLRAYRYIDGEYVYDPLPVPEEPEIPDTPSAGADVWDELDAAYQEGVDSV